MVDVLVNIIPTNVVDAMAKGSMLQVIFFALVLGGIGWALMRNVRTAGWRQGAAFTAFSVVCVVAVCLAVFGLLGFRSMTAQVVLLLECCPSAAITSVFAVQFGHDESFAAGSVVLTTLLSIVALPLCALVVTLL